MASVFAISGAIFAADPRIIGVGYVCGVIPMVICGRVGSPHRRFLLAIVLPVAITAAFVWPVLIAAPPGGVPGNDRIGAVRFACAMVLRLAFVGGIVQACLLSIPPAELARTLRRWGLRGEWLVAGLGAMVVAPEMKRRAERVLTAAVARGLLPDRSLWSRMRIIPSMLLPLTAWSLRSAISRADAWHERRLLDRIERLAGEQETGSIMTTMFLVAISSLWMTFSILSRWAWK